MTERSFSRGDFYRMGALLLVEAGAEQTEAGDRIPQSAWDEAFECGLTVLHRPLHGDAYTTLTDSGRRQLDVFFGGAL